MRIIRRLCCFFGLHELPPGVQHQWSLYWSCQRCGQFMPGGIAERRRR
jgi:hypothetical protein